MKNTGKFASKEDIEKLIRLVTKVFSVGEGIRKDQAAVDAKKACHQLALDYGLPEVEGYYGITHEGEFVSV